MKYNPGEGEKVKPIGWVSNGVPTGVNCPLPNSNIFPERKPRSYDEFLQDAFLENYSSCNDREDVVEKILMEEVNMKETDKDKAKYQNL